MAASEKIRVAVLYGGRSGEHEVSLLSATNVIQYLDRERFEVIPIGIDKQGVWFVGEDSFKKELSHKAPLMLPQEAERTLFDPYLFGKQNQSLQLADKKTRATERLFDVIFPVIHGVLCEDGVVQGLLELVDVPYVGCGVLSSAIGMDKDISKRLVKAAGIHVASYLVIKRAEWEIQTEEFCNRVSETLQFPVFVKPVNTGSSVGVEKVKCKEELKSAIEAAFQYDNKVIVEQGIDAIELEVAVLESLSSTTAPIVSVVGEVRSRHEFYSYTAKYLDENGAELFIPAEISEDLQERVRQVAKEIFLALDCEGMARVDLFLDRRTQQIYFNEVNTIPGFTQISMYPKLMAASGIGYSDLLTHLVLLAMERQRRKNKLSREYNAKLKENS